MAESEWGLTLVQMTRPHDIVVSEKVWVIGPARRQPDIREVADSGSRRCLPIRDRIEADKVVGDVALSACEGAS